MSELQLFVVFAIDSLFGDGQPDVLFDRLLQDVRGVCAHEAGLVFRNRELASVIGCAGHLVVAVEIALEIVLAAVSPTQAMAATIP